MSENIKKIQCCNKNVGDDDEDQKWIEGMWIAI